MADKEASVYIIDLGESMGECHNGRSESDLDWSMRYVWDKICTTAAAGRKTWTVGVVGVRTDVTDNLLQEDEGYDNIQVLQEISIMGLTSVRALKAKIKPSATMEGDAVSAIIVATDLIERAAPKRLKFNRRIFLVTDALGPIDSDDLDEVSNKINDLGIELVVIGVDFDDAEYGFKEEDKSKAKARNEILLQSLVDKCNGGVFGTMAQAVEELEMPRIKTTRPFKTYDGPLTLGNPEQYESAISINIERYFKTKSARPPTASAVVVKSEVGPTQSTQTLDEVETAGGFSAVTTLRTYKIEAPDEPGGKKDVDSKDLARGYEYGRTVVHISESEHNITKLETTRSFTIIGFIPNDKYEPFLNMGESCVIVARKFSETDELALSALIHTLYETESYAVARFVAKDMSEPQLLLLMPSIEPDFECLYDVPLPFAEDVRLYQFPPLDKVMTVSGGVIKKHRLLPNDELSEAMSEYVDAMDISGYDVDDDGNPVEYAPIEDNFAPAIHRVNQAIKFRVVHPDEPFHGEVGGVLTRFDRPPAGLVESARPEIDSLIKAADVKIVPDKAKSKRGREQVAPLSGLDVDALLSQNKRAKISAENSIPEFRQGLKGTVEVDQIQELTKQMGQIVRSLISNSTGDLGYDRAAENMRVMREEMVELEEPGFYNTFLQDLKQQLAAEELGGPRLDMWWKIRMTGLGPITKRQSDKSDVSDEAAQEFLRYLKPLA